MDDPPKPKGAARGMQLGKGRKGAKDFLEAMRAEGENMSVSCWGSQHQPPLWHSAFVPQLGRCLVLPGALERYPTGQLLRAALRGVATLSTAGWPQV